MINFSTPIDLAEFINNPHVIEDMNIKEDRYSDEDEDEDEDEFEDEDEEAIIEGIDVNSHQMDLLGLSNSDF